MRCSVAGFLDGGDRVSPNSTLSQTTFAGRNSILGSEDSHPEYRNYSMPSQKASSMATTGFPVAPPTTRTATRSYPLDYTLRVTNLSPILFAHVADLYALLRPFGPIKNMAFLLNSNEMAGSRHYANSLPQHSTLQSHPRFLERSSCVSSNSAVFEYVNISDAIEARVTLHGQVYAGLPLHIHFVNAEGNFSP